MGRYYLEDIERGAAYILAHLASEGEFVYSEHLDVDDSLMPDLCAKLEIHDLLENGEVSPEMLLQFGADQLADAGLVRQTLLPDQLPFDEQEFRLDLTSAGRAFLNSGERFRCKDVDL